MLPASLKAKRTTDSPPLLTAYSGKTIQYKGVAEETINILRRSTPMKYFIGIDNSSIDHKIHIIDENCNKLKSFIITNDLSGFKELDNHLKRYKELYIGLELPHGPIIDFLRYKCPISIKTTLNATFFNPINNQTNIFSNKRLSPT